MDWNSDADAILLFPLSLRERVGVRGIYGGRAMPDATPPAWPPGLTDSQPLAPVATRTLDARCCRFHNANCSIRRRGPDGSHDETG